MIDRISLATARGTDSLLRYSLSTPRLHLIPGAPMRWSIFPLLLLILTIGSQERSTKFDVVIYGGTAGGVITAVSAAREGLKVALIEPSNHIGGMVTGGLSATDHGKKETIGGYSLEFYERLGKHYGKE